MRQVNYDALPSVAEERTAERLTRSAANAVITPALLERTEIMTTAKSTPSPAQRCSASGWWYGVHHHGL